MSRPSSCRRTRPLARAALVALLLPALASAAPLTLEQALARAMQRAPTLAGRQAALDAAQALRLNAGELPDPQLVVGVENLPVSGPDRFSLLRDGMTMRRVGWMQEMPNGARREARRQVADARAARERALLDTERLNVRRDTALAWYALHYAQQRLLAFGALEAENRVLQDTLAARLAGGTAMPADAAMARLDALQLADRRDELERDVRKARAALSGWVGAPDAEVSPADPAPVWTVDAGALRATLYQHAELAAFGPMIDMSAGELREAEAMKRGDWSWEVAFQKRGPGLGDMVSFQLRFDLPLWAERRQDPDVAAKRAERARVEAERDEMRRQHAETLEMQLAELEATERARTRIEAQALPLAGERHTLTLASYEAGRADLAAVLAVRRDTVELRLRALELASQAQALRVRLVTLIDAAHAGAAGTHGGHPVPVPDAAAGSPSDRPAGHAPAPHPQHQERRP